MTPTDRGARRSSRWEWPVTIVSVGIVAGTVGYLLWQGATRESPALPIVTAVVDTVVELPNGYVARVEVRNVGEGPAEDVRVVGEIMGDQQTHERAEATVVLLPAGSRQIVGLIFSRDPRVNRLTVRATGFAVP